MMEEEQIECPNCKGLTKQVCVNWNGTLEYLKGLSYCANCRKVHAAGFKEIVQL